MSKSNMGSLRSVRDELGGAKDVNLQSLLRAEAILVDLGVRGRGRGKGKEDDLNELAIAKDMSLGCVSQIGRAHV